MARIHVRDLQALQGTLVGQSDWHRVTQTQVDAFADATGDHQWIHVDAERSRSGPFGATIAHGFLTLSLIPSMQREALELDGVAIGINYGLNRARFLSPVRVDSRVRLAVEIAQVKDRDDGALQVQYAMTVELEGSDRPACVAETIVLYYLAAS